ncbi:MAG: hypothetical protein JWL98_517 [Xanthomonadaceae bacterium]|nr:hypothetical protein [Xanthomonadaceae bacterium]
MRPNGNASLNQALIDFAIQTLSGMVAVFVGIWLALQVEKRKRVQDAREQAEQSTVQLDRAMQSMLGSVIKNMAEAKRILGVLDRKTFIGLIHEGLESAVWDATQAQFIELCGSVDKRVLFAQFFNQVRHLQSFCDFHRNLQLVLAGAADQTDAQMAIIRRDADTQLKELVEELSFCGRLLIGDYGMPVHRRLLGMKPAASDNATHPA